MSYNINAKGSFYLMLNGKLLTDQVDATSDVEADFYAYPFVDGAIALGDYQDNTAVSGSFSLGDSTFTVNNVFDVSDFRYFANDYLAGLASVDGIGGLPTNQEWLPIALDLHWAYWMDNYNPGYPAQDGPITAALLFSGYYLGTETSVVTFTQHDELEFFNEVDFLPQFGFNKVGGPAHEYDLLDEDFYWFIKDYQHDPTPWNSPIAPNSGVADMSLQLAGVSSVSGGITNYMGKTRRFALIPMDGKANNVAKEFVDACGLPAFNSDYIIQASFIDLQTGQRMKNPWPVTFITWRLDGDNPANLKAAVRFKAGSELSGKVN
jgi:hypothetical protein